MWFHGKHQKRPSATRSDSPTLCETPATARTTDLDEWGLSQVDAVEANVDKAA